MSVALFQHRRQVTVDKSRLHSLSWKKANKRRTLVLTPSMRRPVGVKWILDRLGWSLGFLSTESAAGAMLPSALSRSDSYSLGACWAFSFQPVLPSVWRPAILLLQSGTRARRLTQSPELGFRLLI